MDAKTFRSPPPPTDAPPIPFDLIVYRLKEETPPGHDPVYVEEVQTFTARPFVSGGLLTQVELITNQNPGTHARGGDAIYDFFYGALIPADADRFRAVLEAEDVYVHSSVLSDVALWLYEKYANRPTNRT